MWCFIVVFLFHLRSYARQRDSFILPGLHRNSPLECLMKCSVPHGVCQIKSACFWTSVSARHPCSEGTVCSFSKYLSTPCVHVKSEAAPWHSRHLSGLCCSELWNRTHVMLFTMTKEVVYLVVCQQGYTRAPGHFYIILLFYSTKILCWVSLLPSQFRGYLCYVKMDRNNSLILKSLFLLK